MKKCLPLFLSLMVLLSLTSCGNQPSTLPTIKVMTQSLDASAEGPDYWLIRPGKRPKHTKAFTPDQASIYEVDCSLLRAEVIDGKVQNQIDGIRITDQSGDQIEDNTLDSIVEHTAEAIDHTIYQFTIIEDFGYYFIFIKLNVNWSDPCELYLYDADSDTLQPLARWDKVDLIGIQVEESF